MALKRPKYFDPKTFRQSTLAESWSKIHTDEEGISEVTEKNDSDASIFKTPMKTYSKSRITRSSSKAKDNQVEANHNNLSDEDEVVGSSQETRESKLRQNINKTTARRSVTPRTTPQKVNTLTPGSNEKRFSISDVCDVNSTVIKEELIEMFDGIVDYECIGGNLDLGGIIANIELKSEPEELGEESHDPGNISSVQKEVEGDETSLGNDNKRKMSLRTRLNSEKSPPESRKSSVNTNIKSKALPLRSNNSINKNKSRTLNKSKNETKEADDELTEEERWVSFIKSLFENLKYLKYLYFFIET